MCVHRGAPGEGVDIASPQQRRIVGTLRRGCAGLVGSHPGQLDVAGPGRDHSAHLSVYRPIRTECPTPLRDINFGQAEVIRSADHLVLEALVSCRVARRELRDSHVDGALGPTESESVSFREARGRDNVASQ